MLIVFGHSGFIGGNIYRKALAHGTDVVGASSKELDLRDGAAVKIFFDTRDCLCDVVMASVRNKAYCADESCVSDNVSMVRNVVRSGGDKIRSMLLLSSVDVYGLSPKLPITEKNELRPQSLYALSKLAAEYSMNFGDEIKYKAIFRLPGVYGKGDGGKSVIGRFCEQCASSGVIIVSGDGNVLRDYLHIDDLCNIIFRWIEKPVSGLFNVATGESLSVCEVAKIIALGVGANVEFVEKGDGAVAVGDLVFDISRLKSAFSFWEPLEILKKRGS